MFKVFLVDQNQSFNFVIDNFLIAPPTSEICAFKDGSYPTREERRGEGTEKRLTHLRLSSVAKI